jgi:hypothetical protein
VSLALASHVRWLDHVYLPVRLKNYEIFTLEPLVNLMEQHGAHLPVPYFVPVNMAFKVITINGDIMLFFI